MKYDPAIKAIFTDLDGTLLKDVDTVTERTIRTFEKIREKGILPIICTGRLASQADFAARAIGAEGYMIAMNGLAVYSDYGQGKLIYEACLPDPVWKKICACLLEEGVFFQIYAGNHSYTQADRAELIENCGMTPEEVAFYRPFQVEAEDIIAFFEESAIHVNKFLVCIPDAERLKKVRRRLEKHRDVKVLQSSSCFIEVLPKGADKSRAVRAVSAVAGWLPDDIMVIGDSENDIGMFSEASICVAMGNACDALKAKANYIAPENTEDGVAAILETLLLSEKRLHFAGRIEVIKADEIDESLKDTTRQYLAGNLKLPQKLNFLLDKEVEFGISAYNEYHWEKPHYHTSTTEYCYILSGETRYIDLADQTEHCFREGDFYILRRDTPYLQKCRPGCKLLFAKVPGLNDKVVIETTDEMLHWCAAWENSWK